MPGRVLIGALVAAGLSCGTARVSAAADLVTYTHHGIERTGFLHQPAGLSPGPHPLVIGLHGFSETVDHYRDWMRLEPTADREKFLVFSPAAVDLTWSYGRPINKPMPAVNGQDIDDIDFIRVAIDDLVSKGVADPKRIYVTGLSRGGLMAFTLACALADRLAAVAPLITGMTEFQRDDCRPSRPIPLMVIAGTNDPMQSFGGAQGERGRLLSVPETMNFWRLLHGCTQRETRTLPHRDPDDPTRVSILQWSDCRSGTSPVIYRVEGGGHQIPSLVARASPESEQRMGLRNRDIESADEIWAYFKRFSR